MADWTAITGIVVSGVVGPAVGGVIAWRLARERGDAERVAGDLADYRQVLDEAAMRLRWAAGAAEKMAAGLGADGTWQGEPVADAVASEFEALQLDRQRFFIRFGPQAEVALAFSEAVDRFLEVLEIAIRASAPERPVDPNAPGEVDELLNAAHNAAVRFVDAAHTLAGARLPTR